MKTALGSVGISVSWATVKGLWESLPLLSQITLVIGIVLLILWVGANVVHYLLTKPPIWREFEEELVGFSHSLEVVVLCMNEMWDEYSDSADNLRDVAGRAEFPTSDSKDEQLSRFANAIYGAGTSDSSASLFERSELTDVIGEERFRKFHSERRNIRKQLQYWAIETVGDTQAREYAEDRLRIPSTKNLLKVTAHLEIALADVLGNKDPTRREELKWYTWIVGWYN